MTLSVSGTTVVNQNRSFVLGTATPGSPATGMIRYNSSLTQFEVYNGSAWVAIISSSPATSPAWAWGGRGFGSALGDGTTSNRSSPVSVVGGFGDWVQISAGVLSTLAIRANGTAWSWGTNTFGGLGINSTTTHSSPVSVVGGFTDWVQISASNYFATAIRANGTAWAWGYNGHGRLGDNTTTNRSSPVSVVGGITDWVQISAGNSHTSALRANGTAWGWGRNNFAALGDGTTTSRLSPVSVVGGFTDWVQISAGGNHTTAIRSNGTAWGWGFNNYGRLGNGGTNTVSSPVSVVGGFTDWVQITGGYEFSAAVRANGTAWAWGRNNHGQLGVNTITNYSSPISVVGGFTDWVQISAGRYHSTAIRSNGTAWTWGRNNLGQLGDNTITNRSSPISVVGGFTDWVQISGGHSHTTALRAI